MKANQRSMRYSFLINQTKIYTKSEVIDVVNYIGLHIRALALGDIQYGDKIGIFA